MEICEGQALDRVFLQLGSITIYWYGVIIALGAALGLWLAIRESKRLGLHKDTFVDFLVFAIPIAIISARIYYVAFEWENYANGPFWKVFAIWEGGIAIHGALIGSVITALIFCRVKKISFWKLADIAAPSLILAQGIGRWGNFMNQEAHGGPVSQEAYQNFIQYLPDFINNQMCIDGVLYHPTFLYESLWNILGFVILLLLRRVNLKRGEMFLFYLAWYSFGRFFIEGMRTDSLVAEGLRAAQVISIIGIVLAVIICIIRRRPGANTPRYKDKK
ncbi:phosphatidylglycerol:prolipoprotein diacylglycerol transferase [Terribacillus aidingensis]|uniref:Phosphatidylglycerol--prolipoprotein diacylglyceryl transferase n=1 Tax=Terribacillus aidingensis TaxID=586416 RepID=A0A285N715_9BACI|nr:prolipoprotein diacylglyceryl transferase [Terribacillus aidingensis]SNZ05274.1 phosphatidylglycerol:prolipoprotein diacylglycerol transferase [Terribacillus aidingensis]